MVYDPNQRIWIYEYVDPNTGKAFYVGRTADITRRGAQHDRSSSGCTQLRERIQLSNFRFRDAMRIVPELPNGVPASRAAEFEAFFIIQRDTLYHPERRPDGCNLRHGDHVTALDYEKVKAEIEEGFEWDEVPDEVVHARAKEAVLEDCVEKVGDLVPELSVDLNTAIMERKQVERMHMSAVAIAEALAEEYEGMPAYNEISRATFETDLNSLRDRLNAEDVADDKMLSLVRAIALFGKSEGVEWEMRANVAVHAFRMLAGALETREEARMPDTAAVRNMKLVRNWAAANGGKQPRANALTRKDGSGTMEESTRGAFLSHWKLFKGGGAYKQANRGEADFLMRRVEWWKGFANGSRAEKIANLASKVNSMLKEGYGHKDEPDFDGKKKWPGGSSGTEAKGVYDKMTRIVHGYFKDSDLSTILDGVDLTRAQWYIQRSRANRPSYQAMQKESTAAAQARSHANGVKPMIKKRKLEDEEGGIFEEEEEGNEEGPCEEGGEEGIECDNDSDSDE